MFYCEECRNKNMWPQSFHQSYGRCEDCGKAKACYDVPSKIIAEHSAANASLIREIIAPKKKDIHTAHCCQKHGCKYFGVVGGESACTVVKSGGQESMCNICWEELYEEGGYEDAKLMNEMYRMGEQHAHERFRLIIAEAAKYQEKHRVKEL